MERISINIFSKSESTNFEFPKTKIGKKKTGRLIHTGTHMLLLFQGDSHCTKK